MIGYAQAGAKAQGEDGSPPGLEPVAAYVMRSLLRALAFLHGGGWMHRDIKSDNLLLGPAGAVKLGDFGFAVHLDKEKTSRHSLDISHSNLFESSSPVLS